MKYVLTLLLAVSALMLNAQKNKQTNQKPATEQKPAVEQPVVEPQKTRADSIPIEFAKKAYIYNLAKYYNDISVAKMALYSLLSEDPANIQLRDSLALLYFEVQQFASAALVAQDVVMMDPKNMFATEIAAASLDRLGAKDKALAYYETLYLSNVEDIGTLYRIGFIQLDLKRFTEAMVSADQLFNHPRSKEEKLLFPTTDQKGQEITMQVGALRMKGLIEEAKGNKPKAREYYNEVLKMVPNFELVKKQLADLNK
jgi:tetratricopeptide (TPR) repeat protein